MVEAAEKAQEPGSRMRRAGALVALCARRDGGRPS